jgi:hypothetical protein
MPYKLPPVGTILPAKENTDVPNPGPTRDAGLFNRWLQAQAQNTAFHQNLVSAQEYDNPENGTFQSWRDFNYYAGRAVGPTGQVGDPDATPPKPPAAFVVVVQDGFVFSVERSGKPVVEDQDSTIVEQATGPYIPVCAVPPYRRMAPPQVGGSAR